MSRTIILAVDVARSEPERNVTAAVEVAAGLARDAGDKVIVLHVHEFATGRFGRIRICCLEDEGEQVVADVAGRLSGDGIKAEGAIREVSHGYTARKLLDVADENDARLIVVGSRAHTDLPHLPFGTVAHRLLHLSDRPVLVVPRRKAAS